MIDAKQQTDILAHYLTGRAVKDDYIYQLYKTTISKSRGTSEDKLVNFAFNHAWCLPYLDGALAFLRPESELRRRIYIMFAAMESAPEYADLFLPPKFNLLRTIGVFLVGIRAVFRVIIGVIIIKVGRL